MQAMQLQPSSAQSMQKICCPNCGSPAERHYRAKQQLTECPTCDYLMVTCVQTGNVLEAYAPGIPYRS